MNAPADRLAPVRGEVARGDLVAAERTCRAALAADARDARAHGLLAHVLHRAGRVEEALAHATQAVAIDPGFVPALIEQAAAARALARWSIARSALSELIARMPQPRAALHYDIGVALVGLGEIAQAADAFTRALEIDPRLLEADFKLGVLALNAGLDDEATERFARCLAARQDWPEAWLNYAECLLRRGQPERSVDAALRGIDAKSDDLSALRLFARVLHAARRDYATFLDVKRRICELEPTPKNRVDLALALWEGFQHRAATVLLDETIARWPDYWPARWGRFQYPEVPFVTDEASADAYLGRWREGVEDLAQRIEQDPDRHEEMRDCARLCTNFYTHYVGLPLVDEQRRYGALLERMVGRATTGLPPPRAIAAPGTRRKIGFVSGYFRHHTMMKLFGPMIAGLDRERFEVQAYMLEEQVDAETEKLRSQVDVFVSGQPDAARWIGTLAASDLDVLVYLDIGMHPVAQVLSALRFAPVQCVLWGHPVTTGRSTIDYFLSSELMEPPGAEAHYTEQLVRLPNLATYYVPPDVEPVVPESFVPNPHTDGVDYFFAQTVYKNTPVHDEVFARIAAELPGARFHMLPHPMRHVRDELLARIRTTFERHGLDVDRHVVMHPALPLAQFLGLARACDVNLDSIGWSGGNTTLEILWHDVPTLTLPGLVMRARHTCAMLQLLKLDELVANDVDDFVARAIQLGREPMVRSRIAAAIRERKSQLYRDLKATNALSGWLAAIAPRV